MSSHNLGYPEVQKSITNPTVKSAFAIDVNEPMSFLAFIKNLSTNYTPNELKNYYNSYLQQWNKIKNVVSSDNDQIVRNRYLEFIKEINLKYTTLEEKKYLKKLDLTDPYDIEIASSFYSKKLIDICNYYKNKREEVKFENVKKKLTGSVTGINKTIRESILNYIDSLENSQIILDEGGIKQFLEIEIEELYDSYPNYFNQLPDSSIYDFKDIDWGEDIFIKPNDELLATVFFEASEEISNLKELDSLIDNKRLLTQNNIFTNFYYISTGSTTTDFVSGLAFTSNNPSVNVFNREYPTTASSLGREYLQTARDKGFFKPSKTSIIIVDGKNSSFRFNLDSLEPNKVYYFPDPNIIGKNGEVLTFTTDDSFLKYNSFNGNLKNQPINHSDKNDYYGYIQRTEVTKDKYLDFIFDEGYISDSKSDIYGNLFGLFKLSNNYNQNILSITPDVIKNMVLNGGDIFDELYGEGYGFDYSVVDTSTYIETIRSGLTSYTGELTGVSGHQYLFFGAITPYQDLIPPTESNLTTQYFIKDGGFFLKSDFSTYDDPISSDLSAFPGGSDYYFNELLEGGINNASTLQRALLDPSFPTLTAIMTESVRPSGNNGVELLDGGLFTDEFIFNFEFPSTDYLYLPNSNTETISITLSTNKQFFNDRKDLEGKLYVKNAYSSRVKSLTSAIPHLLTKYSPEAVSQLDNNIKTFELAYDTLFIQTSSYLIIDKLEYDGKDFVNNNSNKIELPYNSDEFNKISNRFKVGNKIYFCVLSSVDNVGTFLPKIYSYDLETNLNSLIHPTNTLTEYITCSSSNVSYTSIGNPILTYNSRNNIFDISFVLYDMNNYPYINSTEFYIVPEFSFIGNTITNPNIDNQTYSLNSSYNSTLSVYTSTTNISAGEGLLII